MGCSQNYGLLFVLRHLMIRGTKMGPEFWDVDGV